MPTRDETPPTILVVDDDEDVIETYELWLAEEYDLRTATDGEEALTLLDQSVDVVVLDRLMPGLSGKEVLERIRDAGFDCQVVMATAVEPDIEIVDMPFDAYITKALDRDDVRETIEHLLARSEYDTLTQEHYAVAEKLSALEAQQTESDLVESDEYQRLRDRFNELDEQLAGHSVTDMSAELVGSLSNIEKGNTAGSDVEAGDTTSSDSAEGATGESDSTGPTTMDSPPPDAYKLLATERNATRAIPPGKTLLVSAPLPAGQQFIMRSLKQGLCNDEGGLVITTDDTAAAITEALEEMDAPTDRLRIIDCQTDTTGVTDDPAVVQDVDTPRDLTDIGIGFTNAFDDFEEMNTDRGRCGLLSLTILLSYVDQETAYRFCQTLSRGLNEKGFFGLLLLDQNAHDTQTVTTLRRAVDGMIEIKPSEDAYELRITDINDVSSSWIPITL